MIKLIIINGPNLNLIGKRETGIYGNQSFEEFLSVLKKKYPEIEIDYFQSNVEGEIINKIHETGYTYNGIIINAGGYTHTSVAIADAIAAITTPVIEVHISNIFAREDFRHISMIASKCNGSIIGMGLKGYQLAVEYFIDNN